MDMAALTVATRGRRGAAVDGIADA
jgi:hypothetical protein